MHSDCNAEGLQNRQSSLCKSHVLFVQSASSVADDGLSPDGEGAVDEWQRRSVSGTTSDRYAATIAPMAGTPPSAPSTGRQRAVRGRRPSGGAM